MESFKAIIVVILIQLLTTECSSAQETLPVPHFLYEENISKQLFDLRKNNVLLFQIPEYKMNKSLNKGDRSNSWLSFVVSDSVNFYNVIVFLNDKLVRKTKLEKKSFVFDPNDFLPAVKEENKLKFVSPIVNSTKTEFYSFYPKNKKPFYFELGASTTYSSDGKRDIYRIEYAEKLKKYLKPCIDSLQMN